MSFLYRALSQHSKVCWFRRTFHLSSFTWRGRNWLAALGALLALTFVLAGCSWPFGGDSKTDVKATPTSAPPAQVALTKVPWCGQPLVVFQDDGAAPTATSSPATGTATATSSPTAAAQGTPRTLTDWNQVKPALDFTVYLPATLPSNTCLVSASGTIHDPILGSSFTIGYLLADHSSMTFSEAPLRSQAGSFQCSPSNPGSSGTKTTATAGANGTGLMLCTGARSTTHIVFSARGTTTSLQQMFTALQPDVNWVPANG